MNLTNEQIQALKAAAEKATPGRIGDRNNGSIKYTCRGNDGTLVLSTDNHDDYGFVGENNHYDEAFFRACDPAVILSLLAEREADKALIAEQAKRIDFLKEQLAQLANFNPDWDKLEAATDSLREHMAELTAANKRIAELDASHSKLRESMAAIHNTIRLDGAGTSLAALLSASKRAYEDSAAATGIKLQIKE